MNTIGVEAQPMKAPKEKPSVRLHFPQGGGITPKGFDTAGVNDQVTITLTGRVSEIRDRADQWDAGKTLQLEIKGCTIDGPRGKTPAMADAFRKAKAQRTL